MDNGRPQKSATARLHIEWIRKPPPSPVPLAFEEPFYNFTVLESDRVTEIVGVVSVQPTNTPLWFDIVGKSTPGRARGGTVMEGRQASRAEPPHGAASAAQSQTEAPRPCALAGSQPRLTDRTPMSVCVVWIPLSHWLRSFLLCWWYWTCCPAFLSFLHLFSAFCSLSCSRLPCFKAASMPERCSLFCRQLVGRTAQQKVPLVHTRYHTVPHSASEALPPSSGRGWCWPVPPAGATSPEPRQAVWVGSGRSAFLFPLLLRNVGVDFLSVTACFTLWVFATETWRLPQPPLQ